jgi:hypothetical protein
MRPDFSSTGSARPALIENKSGEFAVWRVFMALRWHKRTIFAPAKTGF